MLPVELLTPGELAESISERVKALRLARGWTQQETAERAGITLGTYRHFERTGSIALERLLKLAVILNAQAGFAALFALPPARSLAELAARTELQPRRRGKRRDAQA
ncbi:MAG: hypothetical protein JWM27_636 [Gemmatimonadetes bacterium]|nr:hypothetical protein [Gemmatimonadota bacterium]